MKSINLPSKHQTVSACASVTSNCNQSLKLSSVCKKALRNCPCIQIHDSLTLAMMRMSVSKSLRRSHCTGVCVLISHWIDTKACQHVQCLCGNVSVCSKCVSVLKLQCHQKQLQNNENIQRPCIMLFLFNK